MSEKVNYTAENEAYRVQQAEGRKQWIQKMNRELAELLERYLDLCPRMNDDDPIGPALRDCCKDTKAMLIKYGFRKRPTIDHSERVLDMVKNNPL